MPVIDTEGSKTRFKQNFSVYLILILGCRPREAAFLAENPNSFSKICKGTLLSYHDSDSSYIAKIPAKFTKTKK